MHTRTGPVISLLTVLFAIESGSLLGEGREGEPMPEIVRIMSFNLWHGGDAGKQAIDRTIEVIIKSQADIVGLQETAGLAPEGNPRPDRVADLARRLGWHYVDQVERKGVISRFPIVGTTPQKHGVKLTLTSARQLYLFNVHLAHAPYQPYQLLGIPYEDAPFLKTAQQAIEAARAARGEPVHQLLTEVSAVLAEGLPTFITGDFNEPSHLDWTAVAFTAKQCPLPVEWPSTKAVEESGFIDAFRHVYPDPLQRPGYTWTPTTEITDSNDRHDRIDFVFVLRTAARIKAVNIIGESREYADIVVQPYPSDHRAVVAEVELGLAAP